MSFLGIFFQVIFVYFYLTFLLRFFGKKELSQLNVYDFVVFLIIAELMIMSFGSEEISIFHSVVASMTIVLLDKLISYFSMKNKVIRDMLEGRPAYIILQGRLQKEVMKKLSYTVDDLCHQLRTGGVGSLQEVEFAILETNGMLSIIQKKGCNTALPSPLILDGCIDETCLKMIEKDSSWLIRELDGIDYQDVFYCTLEKNGLFIIKK